MHVARLIEKSAPVHWCQTQYIGTSIIGAYGCDFVEIHVHVHVVMHWVWSRLLLHVLV